MVRSIVGRENHVSLGSQSPPCPVNTEGIPSLAKLHHLSALGCTLTQYPSLAAAHVGGFQGRGQCD